MFGLSKLVALILAFTLGFSIGAGALVGGVAIVLSNFTVRDLERNGIPIPDEAVIGENPEVDILDLTAIELIDEIKALQNFGDEVTINFLKERYAIKFHEKLDSVLSEEARNMPLKQLLSMDGLHTILGTVYIGNIENYVCYNSDGTEGGDPKDETSYWLNPENNHVISGIEDVIADFSLDDFLSGNINTDNLLGDIYISDVLGYTYDETLGYWVDENGNKVTGVMAVFADCHIDEVSTKMNTVELGELLGYEKGEDGNWYETKEGATEATLVNGLMSKIANSNLENVSGVFDTLVLGDVVTERTGVLSIIPEDTKLKNINTTVNQKVKTTPLQFFINEDLVTFEDGQMIALDATDEKANVDADEYNTYYKDAYPVDANSDGTYSIPKWRTVELSNSFSHILGIFTK